MAGGVLAWGHAMRSTLKVSELQSSDGFTALPVDGIPIAVVARVSRRLGCGIAMRGVTQDVFASGAGSGRRERYWALIAF